LWHPDRNKIFNGSCGTGCVGEEKRQKKKDKRKKIKEKRRHKLRDSATKIKDIMPGRDEEQLGSRIL
jgi:hypothetical protein